MALLANGTDWTYGINWANWTDRTYRTFWRTNGANWTDRAYRT